MTSYTRKLYNSDPAAALAYHRQSQREAFLQYFHHEPSPPRAFGTRRLPPSAQSACSTNCGHPACSQGCVLFVTQE